MMILKQRFLKVDNKVRSDPKYPAGFMDVITLEATGDKFRLLYDTKGRFVLHKLKTTDAKKTKVKDEVPIKYPDEVGIKLCKVKKMMYGPGRRPFLCTHDGRTICFPDPKIKRGDSVVVDLENGKIKESIRFKPGCIAMVTAGGNTGRVGEVVSREKHPGSFDIVHLKDSTNATFATRIDNVFVIAANAKEPIVSLPREKGIRLSLVEERFRKMALLRQKGKESKK
jgi:small subunit ribosomal protein S4e